MINTTFFATLVYLKQPCASIFGVSVEKENLPTWDLPTWDLGPGTWDYSISYRFLFGCYYVCFDQQSMHTKS